MCLDRVSVLDVYKHDEMKESVLCDNLPYFRLPASSILKIFIVLLSPVTSKNACLLPWIVFVKFFIIKPEGSDVINFHWSC